MGNDLFFREFNFSDDLDRLLSELETNAKQPPPNSFDGFLRDCEKRQSANRVYVPIKSQFAKATAVCRGGYYFASEHFANIRLTVKVDGVFQMTIDMDHPIELSCYGPMMRCLFWAMINADQFSIDSIEKHRFKLVFRLLLYRVILLPP